jgi:magnesium and cobalt exporter, CNNM family
MSVSVVVLLFMAVILGSMFFSGSETGVLSLNDIDLRQEAGRGNKRAVRLLKLLEKKDVLLATLLIGNNLCIVTASALTTSLLTTVFGNWGPHVSTLVVTPFILVFGEVVPKAVYLGRGTRLLMLSDWILTGCMWLLKPLAKTVVSIPRWITPGSKATGNGALTRDDLHFLLHTGASQKIMQDEERQMLENLLDFSSKSVRTAMVPLLDVVCIDRNETVRTAAEIVNFQGVSRLPVYNQKPENVEGVLFAVDLLSCTNPDLPVSEVMRKPHFVPEQKEVTALLPDIWNRYELVIVVDEYGVATGIITAEDLVEQIVGDIKDEFDYRDTPDSIPLIDGVFIVNAGISISDFNKIAGDIVPPGDYVTLAGFITQHMQRIPERGESFYLNNVEFRILEATPRRIQKVLLRTEKAKT